MKVSLIGTGYWGAKYIPELFDLHDEGVLEFVGCADISNDRLRHAERDHPRLVGLLRSEDHTDLIRISDAAVIAVPNQAHFDVAMAWIGRGKHVLVEKPISDTAEKASTLRSFGIKKRVSVQPGHMYRHSKLVKEIQSIIASKYLGQIEGINMRWITPMIGSSRDLLLDLLPHTIDMLNMLTGRWPTAIEGMYDGVPAKISHATIRYDIDGMSARVEIGWFLPEKHRSVEIIGSNFWLHTDLVNDYQFIHITDPNTGKVEDRWVVPNNTIQDQLRFFARRGDSSRMLTAAVEGIRLIEATRKALG